MHEEQGFFSLETMYLSKETAEMLKEVIHGLKKLKAIQVLFQNNNGKIIIYKLKAIHKWQPSVYFTI